MGIFDAFNKDKNTINIQGYGETSVDDAVSIAAGRVLPQHQGAAQEALEDKFGKEQVVKLIQRKGKAVILRRRPGLKENNHS